MLCIDIVPICPVVSRQRKSYTFTISIFLTIDNKSILLTRNVIYTVTPCVNTSGGSSGEASEAEPHLTIAQKKEV